jgi:hypothetical protein
VIGAAAARYGRTRPERAVAAARRARRVAGRRVNDSPGPVAIAGLAAVLSIEGGLVHRVLAVPVLRRIAPPVAAALPQEQ